MSTRRTTTGKTIIFDVDGVLADFVLGFTAIAGAPEPWGTREGRQKLWSFRDVFSPEQISNAWEKLKSSDSFWRDLPPLQSPEVFDAIDELQLSHHVLFVTARVSYKNAQEQTKLFLEDHGVMNPSVIVSPKKGEIAAAVAADYHVDDKPENVACVHWMADKQPCRSYFYEVEPNNKGVWLPEKIRRIQSLSEFIEDVKENR